MQPAHALVVTCFLIFALRRLLNYLHMLQQDDYERSRFLRWLVSNRAFDQRLSGLLIIVLVAFWVTGVFGVSVNNQAPWVLSCAFLIFAYQEPNPLRGAKKPLVLTSRAQRILIVGWGLCFLLSFQAPLLSNWTWIILIQAVPLLLAAADFLLTPIEYLIQRRYRNAAKVLLSEVKPRTIGITGSFGKTSVKHILHHILAMESQTLATPGSINTPMGITRIVRQEMKPGMRNFIVEMGAYREGSIRRLCELTPPNFGILTAIGPAHYERFKTLEVVTKTKFELAAAVLQDAAGRMVVCESVLEQPFAQHFIEQSRNRFSIYGYQANADLRIVSVEQTAQGLEMKFLWRGQEYDCFAPLFGLHHALNVSGAVLAAVLLGTAVERAIFALRTVPQIKHRLQVKTESDGRITIDDAFNSNPQGFKSALELLHFLAKGVRRRILVTPGMAELGEKHADAHRELGYFAASRVDVALVVRPDQIPTFMDGIRSAGSAVEIRSCKSFSEASSWLQQNARSSDIVLIENDLPDILERKMML